MDEDIEKHFVSCLYTLLRSHDQLVSSSLEEFDSLCHSTKEPIDLEDFVLIYNKLPNGYIDCKIGVKFSLDLMTIQSVTKQVSSFTKLATINQEIDHIRNRLFNMKVFW